MNIQIHRIGSALGIPRGQKIDADDAQPCQEGNHDGKFEAGAEGQQQFGGERQVLLHRGHRLDGVAGKSEKELKAVGENDKIAEKGATDKEQGR